MTTTSPPSRRPATGARRVASIALIALGAVCLLAGLVLLFGRTAVFDADSFSERVTNTLDEPAMQRFVAEQLQERVLENASPQAIAARPVIESVIGSLVATPPFKAVFRRAADELYGALATDTGGRFALGVGDALVIAAGALNRVVPGANLEIGEGTKEALIEFGEKRRTARLIQIGRDVRFFGLIGVPIAVALFVAGIAVAPRRRRAAVWVGVASALVGLLIVVAWNVARPIVLGRIDADLVDPAAAEVLFDALTADITGWGVVTLGLGVLVAVAAGGILEPGRAGSRWARLKALATGPLRSPWARLGRVALAVLVGALLIFDPVTMLQLAALALGVVVLLFALGEVIQLIDPKGAAAAAGEGRHDERRATGRLLLRGGIVAATVLVIAIGVFFGIRGDGGSYGEAGATTCNGFAELCDRPITDVAFAATHNSMSAADQPDWLRAEHGYGIPTQLERGVRGFLFDTWYGKPGPDGVATDFYRSGVTRADLVKDYGEEVVRGIERFRGRLGFGRDNEPDQVYLCHVACEIGNTPVDKALGWFKDFLIKNPGEVLVFVIQDQTEARDIRDAFARSGLLDYVYTHPEGEPWPTLGELIERDQRIVVMLESGKTQGVSWMLPAFEIMQETQYRFSKPEEMSCEPNRGGTGKPFFQMNHWIESSIPNPADADRVNAFAFLGGRAVRCERQRGQVPNLVAVNFFRRGDLFPVVNVLNGLPRTATPRKTS